MKKSKSSNPKSKNPNESKRQYAAVAQTKIMRTPVPQLSSSIVNGDARIRIRHREFITDINGSVAFAVTAYAINPGISSTFQWLSQMAFNYECYVPKNISFEFETVKSTATSGSIQMAVDFDAADATPGSKQELMTFHNAVRSSVWAECCYRCDSKDLNRLPSRYIRSGALAANQDIKLSDVGNLFVSTVGCADTSSIGELYVTYDIELMTPQFSISNQALGFHSTVNSGGTVSKTAYLGTAAVVTGYVTASGNTLTFNRVGQFVLNSLLGGTVFSSAATPVISGTATATASYNPNLLINVGATLARFAIVVTVTASGQTLIVDYSATCTTLIISVNSITVWPASVVFT